MPTSLVPTLCVKAESTSSLKPKTIGVSAVGIGHALGCLRFCIEELAKEGIEVEHGPGAHSRSAVQQKLIEIEADIEAATLSVLRATTLADSGQANSLEAAICKSKAGEIARSVPQRCLEILGAAASAGSTWSKSGSGTPVSPTSTKAPARSCG